MSSFAIIIEVKGITMAKNEIFAPYHPGELLRETLVELGVSQYRFAKVTGISPAVLCGICKGKRSVSADSAIRIARALGTDAQSWTNMQAFYDLEVAERKNAAVFKKIRVLPQVAETAFVA